MLSGRENISRCCLEGGIVNKCELRPTLIVIDVHKTITMKKIFFLALKVRRENSLSVLSGRENIFKCCAEGKLVLGAVWEGTHLLVLCGREESLTNAR